MPAPLYTIWTPLDSCSDDQQLALRRGESVDPASPITPAQRASYDSFFARFNPTLYDREAELIKLIFDATVHPQIAAGLRAWRGIFGLRWIAEFHAVSESDHQSLSSMFMGFDLACLHIGREIDLCSIGYVAEPAPVDARTIAEKWLHLRPGSRAHTEATAALTFFNPILIVSHDTDWVFTRTTA